MTRVIGTDSGTKSYDIFGFDDETNEVFVDESIPRELMVSNPSIVVKRLKNLVKTYRVEVVVASSGYGIPLKPAYEASYEEIAMATFISEKEALKGHRILGLRKLLRLIKEDPELNRITYFTPGVIQLPTVPIYRKINRIDMGTSDKIYTAALAIARHAERFGIDYRHVDIIAVEIGFAYTSALAIRNGEIVDAIAGTAGFPGYIGTGFVDGELMYAIKNIDVEFPKEALFRGGAAWLSLQDPFKTPIDEFIGKQPGYELLLESIAKDILVLLYSVKPQAIYLSGRFTRIDRFVKDSINTILKSIKNVEKCELAIMKLESRCRIAKEAAEGAAIIASGLAGGRYRELIDVLRLRESSGTIFDYITIVDKKKLIDAYSKYIE